MSNVIDFENFKKNRPVKVIDQIGEPINDWAMRFWSEHNDDKIVYREKVYKFYELNEQKEVVVVESTDHRHYLGCYQAVSIATTEHFPYRAVTSFFSRAYSEENNNPFFSTTIFFANSIHTEKTKSTHTYHEAMQIHESVSEYCKKLRVEFYKKKLEFALDETTP